MSFETLVPARGSRRGDPDEVRLRLAREGATKALSLSIAIGGGIVGRLGWAKGCRVHIGVGKAGTPDQGRLSVWAAEDGHSRLQSPGATSALRVTTRALHPTLILDDVPPTAATVVLAEAGRLTVRIPTAFLRLAARDDPPDEPIRRRA